MLNFESKIMPQQHVIRGSFGAILALIWKTRDKNRHMKMLILSSINVRNLEVLATLVKISEQNWLLSEIRYREQDTFGGEKPSDSLELEFLVIVSHPLCVMGTKPTLFTKTASPLNHFANSPVPPHYKTYKVLN